LSRWRTGGQSSMDLVREFVQELSHASAADAWQRALLLVTKDTLNGAGEPRLRLTAHEEAPSADHPFFWAGYLLADTGTLPQELADKMRDEQAEKDPAAEKPAAKRKAPAAGAVGQPRAQGGAENPAAGGATPFPTVGGVGGLGQTPAQEPGAPQQPGGQPAFGMPLDADAQQQKQPQQGGLPQQVPSGAGGFNRGRGGMTPGGFGAPNNGAPGAGANGAPNGAANGVGNGLPNGGPNGAAGNNAGLGPAGGPTQGGFDGAADEEPTGKPTRKGKTPKTPRTRTPKAQQADEEVNNLFSDDAGMDDGSGNTTPKRPRTKAPPKTKKPTNPKAPKVKDDDSSSPAAAPK
jgi:hypothetical protein